jgi:hypothetical protein
MAHRSLPSAAALFASLLVAVHAPGQASQCSAGSPVPISGKIKNNFATADGTQTLGVVAMVYGPKSNAQKLKCALHGVAVGGSADINFLHSISCDDTIDTPILGAGPTVPVHSSIVLLTTGYVYPPQTPTQVFTFQETSVPWAGAPGRGLFAGVTEGQVDVTGAVYAAPDGASPGSIDMKFSGYLCK